MQWNNIRKGRHTRRTQEAKKWKNRNLSSILQGRRRFEGNLKFFIVLIPSGRGDNRHFMANGMAENQTRLGCSGLMSGVASCQKIGGGNRLVGPKIALCGVYVSLQRYVGYVASGAFELPAGPWGGNQPKTSQKNSLVWGCTPGTHNSGHKSTAGKMFRTVFARFRPFLGA